MLDIIDAQAGGDVGRVVLGGLEPIPGASVAERANYLREARDDLRQALMRPPLGDRSQSVNLLVTPTTAADADFGLIIMGTMGYPGFSGSNAMCTIAALNLAGQLPVRSEKHPVRIETPVGITSLWVSRAPGQPITVEYEAPVAQLLSHAVSAQTAGGRQVAYDLIDAGVPYVVVDAATAGIDPREATVDQLRACFDPLLDHASSQRRNETGLPQPVTLGLLTEPADDLAAPDGDGVIATNLAVYMAGGVMCHGPTGTGTTALLTWLLARNHIRAGDSVQATSPAGNAFSAALLRTSRSNTGVQVHTAVAGKPLALGRQHVDLRL